MKRLKEGGNKNRWEDLQTTMQVWKGDEEGLGRKPQPSKDCQPWLHCLCWALSPAGNSLGIVASGVLLLEAVS